MSDTAGPDRLSHEHFEARVKARRGLSLPSRLAEASPHETFGLICATCIGVALGITCGLWLSARLASAASASGHARLLPEPHEAGRVAAPSTPEASRPGGPDEAPPASGVGPRADRGVKADEGDRGKSRGGGVDAARPAGEARPPAPAARARAGEAAGIREAPASARDRVSPCPLYASAGALTIRSGAAATLILGGPHGEAVTVGTPNWADISVFREGPAGGKGWVKYSVRSVSRRPGVYSVRFKSRCGSQTIPVTVGRPQAREPGGAWMAPFDKTRRYLLDQPRFIRMSAPYYKGSACQYSTCVPHPDLLAPFLYTHAEISRGGRLTLEMGDRPAYWGHANRPPSMSRRGDREAE